MATKKVVEMPKPVETVDPNRISTDDLIATLVNRVRYEDRGFIYIGILSQASPMKPASQGFGNSAFFKDMDAAFAKALGNETGRPIRRCGRCPAVKRTPPHRQAA